MAGWVLFSSMGSLYATESHTVENVTNLVSVAPGNDNCIDAIVIASFPSSQTGTTVGASDSNSSGAPAECHPYPSSSGGVWYELTGTGGTFMATTCTPGTAYDTRLAVYSSGSSPGDCGDLSCVTANDDIGPFGGCTEAMGASASRIEWATTAGVVYYIYIDGFATTTGVFELSVEETIPAPLTLMKFEGRVAEKVNIIQWETISESNTEWHSVERSANGNERWQEVGRIEAAGFSHQLVNYEIEDADALGIGYYRLKTYDYDGSVEVSSIIRIERSDGGFQLQRVAPVPFDDLLEVQFQSDRNGDAMVEVFDMAGKSVYQMLRSSEDGANRMFLELDWLKAGIYILTIEQEGRRINERIVKRKY